MGTWIGTFVTLLLFPLFVLAHPAWPQTPTATTPFYEGKTIRFIAGSSAGSAPDLYTRAVARHFNKFVPGQPQIIVQNMPGAGGAIAANYSYSVAKQDGLTIGGVFPPGIIHADLLGTPGLGFDSRRFQWLGSASSDVAACMVRHDSGFKTISDVIRSPKPLVVGSPGAGSSMSYIPKALNDVLGANFKLIEGYREGMRVPIERGEIAGMCTFWSTFKVGYADLIKEGRLRILLHVGPSKHPEIPQEVPWLMDLVANAEERLFLEAILTPLRMGRPLAAGPGVAHERVRVLREAFMKTVKDPAFLRDAERTDMEIFNPSSGEEVQSLVEKVFAAPPAIVKRIVGILS